MNYLKNNRSFFDSIIILRFGETKIATKEKFYAAKKSIKIWEVNIDNLIISKLVKTKIYSKYLIGY